MEIRYIIEYKSKPIRIRREEYVRFGGETSTHVSRVFSIRNFIVSWVLGKGEFDEANETDKASEAKGTSYTESRIIGSLSRFLTIWLV